jgi:hypothetical protein
LQSATQTYGETASASRFFAPDVSLLGKEILEKLAGFLELLSVGLIADFDYGIG